MSELENRRKDLYFRVTDFEYRELRKEFSLSGEKNFSEFCRKKILTDQDVIDGDRIKKKISEALETPEVDRILENLNLLTSQSQGDAQQLFNVFLNGVIDLIEVVDNEIELSQEFKTRWMG